MNNLINTIIKLYYKFIINYNNRRDALQREGILRYLFGESGYVLIIVLIVSSLLVTISSEFFSVAQTNVNYLRKFIEKQKASTIAKAGINLGIFILDADKKGLGNVILQKAVDKNIDCYDDIWAMKFPEIPLGDGFLKIKISDENSKINLSVLATENVDKTLYYNITQRFFVNMGLAMDYADVILDWVDIDDARSPYGAESSDYYQTLEPPYNAKNGKMDSIDEILMLKGFTPEIYYGMGGGNTGLEQNLVDDNIGGNQVNGLIMSELNEGITEKLQESNPENEPLSDIGSEKSRRLSDYFRVEGDRKNHLSELNKININTASFRVLSALTDKMTPDKLTEMILLRRENPFTTISQVEPYFSDDEQGKQIHQNYITVKSFIFKIESIGRMRDTTVKITGIFNRENMRFHYWSEQ